MSVKVKGAALLSRRAYVREEFGGASWEKVLETLADEDRRELQTMVLTSSWHPFELNQRLDRAIVEILGGGSQEIFERIGRWSAKQNLGGPHKAFVMGKNAQRFLAASDRIYGYYYDTGHRTYEETGPTSGVITTLEAQTFSATDCLTVIGWYKEGLEMCGATGVQINEETCRARGDDVCRYRLSWDEQGTS